PAILTSDSRRHTPSAHFPTNRACCSSVDHSCAFDQGETFCPHMDKFPSRGRATVPPSNRQPRKSPCPFRSHWPKRNNPASIPPEAAAASPDQTPAQLLPPIQKPPAGRRILSAKATHCRSACKRPPRAHTALSR